MKNANLVSCLGAALILLLGFAGCAAKETKTAAPKTVADFFPIKVGSRTVRMQLAVLPHEMERGLMGRQNLAPDEGMLFVYREPQKLAFWMHDTPTPLDIGFFTANGALAEVYPLLPFDERTVASRSDRLQLALEMNQNWYRDNGVKPGEKIDLTAVRSALRERDFEPKAFGLGE